MKKTKPLSAAAEAVLRKQSITEDSPGPILRDFETFLAFVEERQARVGGTRGLLHGTVLAPLNARLARSTDIRLQRPIQKSYPYINGLYLLARATGLVTVEGTGSMFEFKDRRGVSVRANHPYTEDPPLTDEVRIGEVPLSAGQSMKFVFDFGDWWEFGVKLERVEAGRMLKRPRVLESHGKAPRQYHGWS